MLYVQNNIDYVCNLLQHREEINVRPGLGIGERGTGDGVGCGDGDGDAVGVVARTERQPNLGLRVGVHVLTQERENSIISALIY